MRFPHGRKQKAILPANVKVGKCPHCGAEGPLAFDNFCMNCTLEDALILGENQAIKNIKTGSSVVGVTGLTEVKRSFAHQHSGEVLTIKGLGLLPFHLTPEHEVLSVEAKRVGPEGRKVFGHFEWKAAKALQENHKRSMGSYLVIPRLEGSIIQKELSIAKYTNRRGFKHSRIKNFPLTTETAWLLGLYVAEGVSSERTGIKLCLGKNESRLVERVGKIAKELGFKLWAKQKGSVIAAIIASRILGRAFRDWCGHKAPNKKVPDFIMYNEDENVVRSFLSGYEQGDGSRRAHNIMQVTTVSKILITQLQLLYARVGRFLSIHIKRKEGKGVIQGRAVRLHTAYSGSYSEIPEKLKVRIQRSRILVPVRKIEPMPNQSRIVYNLQTADESYLISNIVTHNCGKNVKETKELGLDYHFSEGVESDKRIRGE